MRALLVVVILIGSMSLAGVAAALPPAPGDGGSSTCLTKQDECHDRVAVYGGLGCLVDPTWCDKVIREQWAKCDVDYLLCMYRQQWPGGGTL